MNNVVLDVKNLTKVYGKRTVVNNVSFQIFPGQIFGFLGANGAGKSTVIKMICGLTSITNGHVFINGKSIKNSFESAIKNIGGVIETPNMYNYMSGYNNLKFFAGLYNGISKARIMEVAELVGLGGRIKDKVSTYSLGMKQRLGIAQALLHSPSLLILDEPTNGLDANGIKEMRTLLKRLSKQGIAILISSHILSEMENLCDTITIINKGEIVETKSMEDIKKSIKNNGSNFIKVNAPNFAGQLIQDHLKLKVAICNDKVLFSANDKQLSQIIMLLTSNKVAIYAAGDVDYSLEDVFLNVINKVNSSTSIA